MNLRFVGFLLGLVVVGLGAGMLVSAGVTAIYGDDDLVALLVSAAICFAVGVPVLAGTRVKGQTRIGYREGFLVVASSWIVAMAFGGVPYILYGLFSPIDAFFESMSGFTTTGASVLTDYAQPHGIMFWRSLTHWYGGMGIIVLVLAILPSLGGGAARIFSAESPGPLSERLTPKIRDTAKNLWLIYVGLTALEALLLVICGMDLFGAITHSFASLATGGFSPMASSVGAYHSLPMELVITVFCAIAGGNFALYFAFIQGHRRRLWRDPELRLYVGILTVSTIVVAISLMVARTHFRWGHAFREALFQVVTIQTTTGFVTADFDQWNSFAKTLLVGLMFIGGCAGSTAGGIKVIRTLLMAKNAHHELVWQVHPQAVLPMKLGGKVIPDRVRWSVLSFFFMYITTFVIGSLLVATSNVGMITAVSAVAATLNNVGPGLELVGATLNYAPIDPFGKVVLIAMMVLGRLELMSVILPFTRAFWRR